jgi:hypothetical protein
MFNLELHIFFKIKQPTIIEIKNQFFYINRLKIIGAILFFMYITGAIKDIFGEIKAKRKMKRVIVKYGKIF